MHRNIIINCCITNSNSNNHIDILLKQTADYMNSINVFQKKSFTPSSFEDFSCECLKYIAKNNPNLGFCENNITLVSGHKFPDIIAGSNNQTYGIEIKSTTSNNWESIGSSIIESTRIQGINNIYLLFGKLGGEKRQVKIRPYGDVMDNIVVTHSPRYHINMNCNTNETIFSKLNTTYQKFHTLSDNEKINKVRDHYLQKAKISGEHVSIPWWIGNSTPITLNIMRNGIMDKSQKLQLTSELLILFPEIINSEYDEAAVWLCTRRNTINPSFRDLFSAGGTCAEINNKLLPKRYPHIIGTLLECNKTIKSILSEPRTDFLKDIQSLWKSPNNNSNMYEHWICLVQEQFNRNHKLKTIPIKSFLKENAKVTKYYSSK